MLEEWTLTNFKSVYEKTSFLLRPLTIFTGANSSGKSTLIQSIMLVAQTVTNPTPTRQLVLNGHMIRLGSFTDVASHGQTHQPITVSFKYRPKRVKDAPIRFYYARDVNYVQCDLSFAPPDHAPSPELRDLHPQVVHCRLEVEHENMETPVVISVDPSGESPADRLKHLGVDAGDVSKEILSTLQYVISPEAFALSRRQGRYPHTDFPEHSQSVGALFRHFVPYAVTICFDATHLNAERMVRSITGLDEHPVVRIPSTEIPFPNPLLARIHQIAKEAVDKVKTARPRAAVVTELDNLPIPLTATALTAFNQRHGHLPGLRTAYEENLPELVKLARDGRPKKMALEYVPVVPEVSHVLQHAFTERFRSLGPLRDDPKAAYPLEGSVDPTHVGLKGEFTAGVLDLNKSQSVTYVTPEDFNRKGLSAPVSKASLLTAVLDWAQHLGVVDRIETRDRGVFGHELRVATASTDSLHNLVHVGVGVSQVLPILVMSLLSESGSVLLFEQPELHLHPRVQTLLGDFLLSLVASGRQCIVETHSEYMVNRLRYRAAADEADSVHQAIALYFVEKSGPRSTYRLVDMNEYGAIGDWPAGFFDQSPAESERILRAAMEKRRARRRRDV
jgi:predicted ATPase